MNRMTGGFIGCGIAITQDGKLTAMQGGGALAGAIGNIHRELRRQLDRHVVQRQMNGLGFINAKTFRQALVSSCAGTRQFSAVGLAWGQAGRAALGSLHGRGQVLGAGPAPASWMSVRCR